MLGKSNCVHHTAFHCLISFSRSHRRWNSAYSFERFAQTAGCTDAHTFEFRQLITRLAGSHEVVLRHGRGHQKFRVPLCHLIRRSGVRVDCAGHSHFLCKVFDAEERKFQHCHNAIFVGVIACAKLCHLESANRNTVEVLAVFGQPAIADIHCKLATRLFGHKLGQFFDMLREGTTLAPDRHVPFCGCRLGHKGKGDRAHSGAGQIFVHDVSP